MLINKMRADEKNFQISLQLPLKNFLQVIKALK